MSHALSLLCPSLEQHLTFHMHSNPTLHLTIYQTFIDTELYPAQIHRLCLSVLWMKRTRPQNTSVGSRLLCFRSFFCRRSSFKFGNVHIKCLFSWLLEPCHHRYLTLLVLFIPHSHSHVAWNTFHLHDGKVRDRMANSMDGKPSQAQAYI